ncbi:MAG: chromosome segregation protein SMC, partial [Ignavibacteria bacterium]|nr:chromosome segregation protein SMC [Ignavibacteria bacterium]
MYLSKLEIIGFKSFAARTALGFDSGISAIVGPNGCGKTNIVDAIRWVLGEQRYSALRSEKMEDVIFNGTKGRKPLGMAEASLVIENTRGVLPSDYTQVTIGRRVYRSGESEYLLNKIPCRLKDIQTLFMDTGMGADAYSVIELKMVESILSDKTDERRHLFEEAAGVTKYKHRRKAAYRKLENVQSDLVRVNDIVTEVQKAVSSLERQAKRAGQYNDVRDQLQSMEVDLMEREFANLNARRAPLLERLETLRGERVHIDGTLNLDEERLEELRTGIAGEESGLAEIQREVSLQRERLNTVRQRMLVASERRRALEETTQRCEEQISSLAGEEARLREGRGTLMARIDECRSGELLARKDLEDARNLLSVLEAKLSQKRTELQSLSDQTIVMVGEIAREQAEQDKKKNRIENVQGRIARSAEDITAYEGEIVRLDEEITRLREEDRRLRRLFADAEVSYYDTEKSRQELADNKEVVHANELQVRGELQHRMAKLEFLEGLVETSEGLSDGVRYLASRPDGPFGKPVTVGDVAVTDHVLRPAIHAGLGSFAGMLVADTYQGAVSAMNELKQRNQGKAGFVCLDRIPEVKRFGAAPRIEGVRGWASDLLTCPDKYRQMFHSILDRVLVVQNRQVAADVLNRTVGITCATLDGELLSGAGMTVGGSSKKDEGGSLGKQAQIDQLREEIADLEIQANGMKRVQEDLQRQFNEIDLKGRQDEVKKVEKEMNSVEVRMA